MIKITKDELKEMFIKQCKADAKISSNKVINDENWEGWFRVVTGKTPEEYLYELDNMSMLTIIKNLIIDWFKNLFRIGE